MSEMGTKAAAELWGVTQRRVQDFCRNTNDARITQDKRVHHIIYRLITRIHLKKNNRRNHK